MSYVLVRFTEHAIERYIERVRPGLDRDAALAALVRLYHFGNIVPDQPDWVGQPQVPDHTVAFLVAGDVVMPLLRSRDGRSTYCATTIITPGTIPEKTRSERNRRRSQRTATRHGAKVAERRLGKRAAGRIRLDGYES